MEERWLWYLAGAIDTAGRITVSITKNDEYTIGYQFTPRITLSRTGEHDVILGMLDEYCMDQGAKYSIDEIDNRKVFTISKPDDVERFLNPLMPRLVQQVEPAQIILEDIIPMMEEDKHITEEGFLEIMERVEELRSHLPSKPYESKYDLDYFQAEFSE